MLMAFEITSAIVTSTAPDLAVKTWYGMPAYAKDGKVLCFFKPAVKFKVRYATLGFTDAAALDDGNVWATGPGGVCVMAPDGTLLGRFLTGDRTANLCFGDDDGQTLYVCVNHRIGRVRVTTKGIGLRSPPAAGCIGRTQRS